MLSFKKDIYLVKGKKRACIYDLNQGVLYHLKEYEVEFIDAILGKEKLLLNLNNYQLDNLDFLLKNDIIEDSPEFNSGDITILAQKPKIDFAWIEVTEQCNLRCIHCYDESCIQNIQRMEIEDFIYVIDELLQVNIKKIQIIGGEPLILGSELTTMLEYCCNKMDFVEIFTNATLINDEWCKLFKNKGIAVAVSVYSYEQFMHEKVTQVKGSFDYTIRGIKLLKKYNIKYRVANVLLKDIEIGVQNTDLFKLSKKRDVVRLTGRAKKELLTVELLKKRLITKESFSKKLNKNTISRMIYGHNCFSRRLYIASDLAVYPCVMERRIKHGNMRNTKLLEVIQESILCYNKNNIEECSECEFRYCCHDCRPDSIKKNINSKPWMCTYYPLEGRWEDVDIFVDNFFNNE